MEKLIIFILATSSLSWILVKSKVFKSFRERITIKRIQSQGVIVNWLDNVLNCIGCAGLYTALISYLLVYQQVTIEGCAFIIAGPIISLIMNNLTNK